MADCSLVRCTMSSKLSSLSVEGVHCPCKRICHPAYRPWLSGAHKTDYRCRQKSLEKCHSALSNTLNSLFVSKLSNSEKPVCFLAIATFFSCDQCNRSTNRRCLPSVTTWERYLAALLFQWSKKHSDFYQCLWCCVTWKERSHLWPNFATPGN